MLELQLLRSAFSFEPLSLPLRSIADKFNDDKSRCASEREAYIGTCRKSWRKYFNERRRVGKKPPVTAVFSNGAVKVDKSQKRTYI